MLAILYSHNDMTPTTDQELQFRVRARRRMIGAIALAVALVVFLPMLLDSSPKPDKKQDIPISIPPQDAAPFNPPQPRQTKAAVSQTPTPSPQGTKADQPEQPGVEAKTKPVTVESIAPDVKEVEDNKDVKGKPKATATAKPAADGVAVKHEGSAEQGVFFVQLGVFSKHENAKQLQAKLAAHQFRFRTDKAGAAGALRVRAGPFNSRVEADKARAELQGMGLIGVVVGP